jgi:hypothetical protein
MRWLVAATFDFLLQFAMLIWLAAGAFIGYNAAASTGSGGLGSLAGFLLALVTGSLVTGIIFTILEIGENLRAIRKKVESVEAPARTNSQTNCQAESIKISLEKIVIVLKSVESLLGQRLSAQEDKPKIVTDRPSESQIIDPTLTDPKTPEDRRRAVLTERMTKANHKIDVEGYETFGDLVNDASRNGNAAARFQLGEFYRDGIVVKKGIEEAIYWFDLAAQAGHQSALAERDRLKSI